jgi:site-specific DNA recombinase
MSRAPVKRCAVYTRKSSDEGLDQAFNSLDAQREAGEAYAKSQVGEGWRVVATRYDDGGFSGGSMERPALQRLLDDVERGRIDVVVVYKIDRLTRSLADFARIVERFDAKGVSFVSVTQAFNTTSSMGRLTLNVLLSFAQFEREVTGERIRDKIAASKAKGMWMGGVPPLGYDIPEPGSRTLRTNEAEAETVRHIFARYLELGSVHALQRELHSTGITSKRHVTLAGRTTGGATFSRGALFHLLRNRVYLGQIVHKEQVHAGAHHAIIDNAIFTAVQQHLDGNARRHQRGEARRVIRAPLTGKIRDAAGEPMSPTFSRSHTGRLYRYYVSASLQQGGRITRDQIVRRVSALRIERLLADCVRRWLRDPGAAIDAVRAVEIDTDQVVVTIVRPKGLHPELASDERLLAMDRTTAQIAVPITLGSDHRAATSRGVSGSEGPDATLIGALRRAHRMLARDSTGPKLEAAPVSIYERKILRLALLAPDIQRDIFAGRQPREFNLETFVNADVPAAWTAQRCAFGWG